MPKKTKGIILTHLDKKSQFENNLLHSLTAFLLNLISRITDGNKSNRFDMFGQFEKTLT